MYVHGVLHQLSVAISTVLTMMEELNEEELDVRPIQGKRSLRELLSHLSLLIKADYLISTEATEAEMNDFYTTYSPTTLKEMRTTLKEGYKEVAMIYHRMTDDMLQEKKQAYWGVSYTRFDWLLEISNHFYHHRSQLHFYLVLNGKDPDFPLFE
ncbi:DinB family protein [Metabacillus iocasae]|uniref:Damage-inducible protein DinB n=1 Tax=Priestia iocasae TaxID=2291674 RepID=A0ABS2QW65_9BACI|nr:DinB family protein [Metabacillus iocasae]MBM7703716.1 putative damage-inducible protein DinB [Metabacillus iocasae]